MAHFKVWMISLFLYLAFDAMPAGSSPASSRSHQRQLGNQEAGSSEPQHSGGVGEHWNYENTDAWVNVNPNCAGPFQSPINIDPATVIRENIPRLIFGNYDQIFPMNITNNGHSVLLHLPLDFPTDQLPYIRAGGLPDRYKFVQLHFHWGADPSRGSEHLIQFQRFQAELHIVHYKSSYGSFAEAVKHRDGLAVLAILIELERRDNTAFRHIVEQFPEIQTEGQETNLLSPIPLADLLPDNVLNFYRYNGSLTTPGCEEIVIWTVFNTPIAISEHQFARFRELFDSDRRILRDNFRPIHLKHGRTVTYRSENGLPLEPPVPTTIGAFPRP